MTITEVSDKYELATDTLRYYERVGFIPTVNRTSGGSRDYSEEDCKWVEFAKCMRVVGLPVESLIEYVALFAQGDTTTEARKQILIEQRDILLAQAEEVQNLLADDEPC